MEDDVNIEMKLPEILGNALQNLPDDWALLYIGHCKEAFFLHMGKVGHRCSSLSTCSAVKGCMLLLLT
jgi:hypothetical protein